MKLDNRPDTTVCLYVDEDSHIQWVFLSPTPLPRRTWDTMLKKADAAWADLSDEDADENSKGNTTIADLVSKDYPAITAQGFHKYYEDTL